MVARCYWGFHRLLMERTSLVNRQRMHKWLNLFECEAGFFLIGLHMSIHPEFTMLDHPDESLSGFVAEGTLDFF